MVVAQSDLARKFAQGATSGKASNVEIREDGDGGAMLVGYGHAVYAYRTPGGKIITFKGWANRNNTRRHSGSQSTKSQYGTMSLTTKADRVVEGTDTDAAPKAIAFNAEKHT